MPKELDEAARVEGCNFLQVLWKVYVPLAKPTYVAYGLVSVSYHWNNFLWPLVITNSVETRPLTVGLAIFGAPESGVDWSIITAGTLLAVAPLLIAFLLFPAPVRAILHARRDQINATVAVRGPFAQPSVYELPRSVRLATGSAVGVLGPAVDDRGRRVFTAVTAVPIAGTVRVGTTWYRVLVCGLFQVICWPSWACSRVWPMQF